CMFSKIERLIEFESESQRTCLTGHGLLEERAEVNSKLVWSSAISTELNSAGSLNALGELQLGAFKQRVISAFLATP
ncbi:diguanylate cyclase, partial [Vibrio lentus]|nr:diguanylate cyclase [Vibrio lentus]